MGDNAGYYETPASIWDEGVTPSCDICQEPAVWEFPGNGEVCDKPECIAQVARAQLYKIEWVSGDSEDQDNQ